jgi:hypothetical protein
MSAARRSLSNGCPGYRNRGLGLTQPEIRDAIANCHDSQKLGRLRQEVTDLNKTDEWDFWGLMLLPRIIRDDINLIQLIALSCKLLILYNSRLPRGN